MNFLSSLRSELIKIRRTSGWYILILIAILTPVILCSDYTRGLPEEIRTGNPWRYFLIQGFQLTSLLALPCVVILLCTLLSQLEIRNNTWKQVFASPQLKLNIYVAKYLTIVMLVVVYFICHIVFSVVIAFAIDAGPANGRFSEYPIPFEEVFSLFGRALVCSLGFIAFQFWLGLRFRNFITAIALGMLIWFLGGMITLEMKLPWGNWHPYMLQGYVLFSRFQDQWPELIMKSIAFALLFLSFGFFDFNSRSVKE